MNLSERLEALLALCECTDDAERDHNAPDSLCVFVDVRPAVFDALLREAAELARSVEDAPAAEVQMLGTLILSDIDHGCLGLVGQRVRLVPEDGQGGGSG